MNESAIWNMCRWFCLSTKLKSEKHRMCFPYCSNRDTSIHRDIFMMEFSPCVILHDALECDWPSWLSKYVKVRFMLLIVLENSDTETLYTVVTQNILDEYSPGTIYEWDVKVTLMGLQKEAVSRKIVELYNLPLTWQEYADLAQAQIEVLMKNCRLMPGMIWLIDKTLLIRYFSFLFFIYLLSLIVNILNVSRMTTKNWPN